MTRGLLDRARQELRESPAVHVGFLALAVILLWSARDGATDPLVWAPWTLFLAALLVVVLVTAPGSIPGGRAGLVALLSFAAYTGWCFLSILWSDVRADAWSGSNKTLAYFCVYALFAARPWRAGAAAALLGCYALGIAAIGLYELLAIARADDPTVGFLEGRLVEPISYYNANCALYLGAALPALFLATRREVPVVLRGLLLAAVGVLVQLALLCQSRMSLLALPVVLALYFVLVPGRLRGLVAIAPVALALAWSGGTLLDVYDAVLEGRGVDAAVSDAASAILVTAAALAVAGVVLGLVDRRVEVPARMTRALGIAASVAALAVAVAAGAVFVDRYGDPVDRVGIWWDAFKANEYVTEAGTPHIVSGFGGAGRYDIWRVALEIFREHPVAGIGVDNFSVDFLRERTVNNDPLYPHSVELRLLQQTGLVGTALMAVFLVSVLVAGATTLLRGPPFARGVAASALLVFAYWLVHGSIDWLWEIPSLSAAVFAALGLFVAMSPAGAERARPRWVAPVVACVVGAVTVATVGPAWLSAREVDAALDSWRATPQAAYDHLDRARAFDRFSDQPDVLGAVIAAQRNELGRQRSLLERALVRNPHNWYPYLELGLLEARSGDRAAGLRALEHASALNPMENVIELALEGVRDGDPPTREEIDEAILRSADTLTGVRQS